MKKKKKKKNLLDIMDEVKRAKMDNYMDKKSNEI